MRSPEQIIRDTLAGVGITIGGDNPWDLQVHNPKLYDRILSAGSIGFGEAYMAGWWDCEALDEFIFRLLYHRADKKIPKDFYTIFYALKAKFKNLQTKGRSKEVVYKHYDIGNELFEKMLDIRMMYSCGYWETANNLDDSQEAKLDLICRKLKLEKGMTLLDLGCGWGWSGKIRCRKIRRNRYRNYPL